MRTTVRAVRCDHLNRPSRAQNSGLTPKFLHNSAFDSEDETEEDSTSLDNKSAPSTHSLSYRSLVDPKDRPFYAYKTLSVVAREQDSKLYDYLKIALAESASSIIVGHNKQRYTTLMLMLHKHAKLTVANVTRHAGHSHHLPAMHKSSLPHPPRTPTATSLPVRNRTRIV